MTTVSEYARLVAKIAVLKEVAEEYPGKTIWKRLRNWRLLWRWIPGKTSHLTWAFCMT